MSAALIQYRRALIREAYAAAKVGDKPRMWAALWAFVCAEDDIRIERRKGAAWKQQATS